MFKIPLLILVLSAASLTGELSYGYTKVAHTLNNKKCLNNCINGTCLAGWTDHEEPCTSADQPSPKFNTSHRNKTYQFCLSNCGTFDYNFTWCIVAEDRGWDYCNPRVSVSPYLEYDIYSYPCKNACSRRRYGWGYYTCETDTSRQSFCALPAGTTVPIDEEPSML